MAAAAQGRLHGGAGGGGARGGRRGPRSARRERAALLLRDAAFAARWPSPRRCWRHAREPLAPAPRARRAAEGRRCAPTASASERPAAPALGLLRGARGGAVARTQVAAPSIGRDKAAAARPIFPALTARMACEKEERAEAAPTTPRGRGGELHDGRGAAALRLGGAAADQSDGGGSWRRAASLAPLRRRGAPPLRRASPPPPAQGAGARERASSLHSRRRCGAAAARADAARARSPRCNARDLVVPRRRSGNRRKCAAARHPAALRRAATTPRARSASPRARARRPAAGSPTARAQREALARGRPPARARRRRRSSSGRRPSRLHRGARARHTRGRSFFPGEFTSRALLTRIDQRIPPRHRRCARARTPPPARASSCLPPRSRGRGGRASCGVDAVARAAPGQGRDMRAADADVGRRPSARRRWRIGARRSARFARARAYHAPSPARRARHTHRPHGHTTPTLLGGRRAAPSAAPRRDRDCTSRRRRRGGGARARA